MENLPNEVKPDFQDDEDQASFKLKMLKEQINYKFSVSLLPSNDAVVQFKSFVYLIVDLYISIPAIHHSRGVVIYHPLWLVPHQQCIVNDSNSFIK